MSNFSFHNQEKQNQLLNPICRFEYITLEGLNTIKNQINGSRNSKDPLLEAAKIGVYIETLRQILFEFGFQYQKNEDNGQYTIFDNNKSKEKRWLIHDNLDHGQKYYGPVAVSLDELVNDGNGIYDFEDVAEMYDTEIVTKRGRNNIEMEDALREKRKGGKSQEIEPESIEEVELCNGYAIGY
ncbi:hypothetical protein F8M41_003266 [Gigaspora margarita]|uniref:Uncharacterized protein n=2 Tax=Gigaspora margarita TaxID=4874 RepID=A0A8H4A7J6_GIGMA|nr:hypothetical protein F8M41_003266 [Gigaspora margarita]